MPENLAYAPNTIYSVERTRSRSEGLIALPIAGAHPQNCSLVRLYAPIEMEIVVWSAVREGAPPQIPSPRSFVENVNRVFLRGSQTGIVPVETLAGHFFALAGVYEYAIVGPESLSSKFYLGKMPWESISVDFNYVPAANFQFGIVSKESQKDETLTPSSAAASINATPTF